MGLTNCENSFEDLKKIQRIMYLLKSSNNQQMLRKIKNDLNNIIKEGEKVVGPIHYETTIRSEIYIG